MSRESSVTLESCRQSPALLMSHDITSDPEQSSAWFTPYLMPPLRVVSKHNDSAFSEFCADISDETLSTLTDYLIGKFEPWHRFLAELDGKLKEAWQTHQAYQSRIETLRGYAALEGLTVNHFSERDFWHFVESVPFACEGDLVLVDSGNLRAVWDGEDGSHLGLQFLGDGMLQYVIFRRREGSGHISRVAGRDTFEGVKKQARVFEIEALQT